MVGEGVRYDNRMTFLGIERPHLIEVDHGSDKDDDPNKFRMLVTFDEQTDGKTVLTLRQMHPTRGRGANAVHWASAQSNSATRHSTSSPPTAGRAQIVGEPMRLQLSLPATSVGPSAKVTKRKKPRPIRAGLCCSRDSDRPCSKRGLLSLPCTS